MQQKMPTSKRETGNATPEDHGGQAQFPPVDRAKRMVRSWFVKSVNQVEALNRVKLRELFGIPASRLNDLTVQPFNEDHS